ncbi:leucine--tRNA ligase [bacterium]|nr:leucine--tRNA ligase [bacterium]
MKKIFDFKKVEEKWRDKWFEGDLYKAVDNDKGRKKKYVLVEFPYPSGSGLHVGHAFSFTGGDVYARFMRMQGYNVLFPMGWDAFGLPTENYAIKVKRKPQDVTKENTDSFREEMKSLGFSFDWSREVNTTDPNYYKWTQLIFIKLFEQGLSYKEERPINWCPSCKIGLADEEVVNGNCERCGTKTSKRNISQWIVKITAYADRLIDGLKDTAFIEKVKAAQINWIDKKEWIDITYPIQGTDETVTVATTRPDTNFGATFIVLAAEHPLVGKLIKGKIKTNQDLDEIQKYVKATLDKSELERQKEVSEGEKTGVFTGIYAINHLTKKPMPIWITDFVLGSVGTGAVVGVPGHDIRDFEFAKQFGLEILRVVVGKDGDQSEITDKKQVQEESGVMINSGFLDGKEINEATKLMMDYIEKQGWGTKTVRYHLRDWIFSRQHYWGEPIPMIKCEKCGWVPVKKSDLPIKLPEVERYEPTETGESPLANMQEWMNTICPVCKGPAKRETDTMPNWAGSDWYFVRYVDPLNKEFIADLSKQSYWLPVDTYIGGDEHNTLHLLYSRFIHQFLYDQKAVTTPEPYYQRVSHGVILGSDNRRMSKTRGNVIVPGDVTAKVGSDVARAYLMFIGPFDSTMAWNESALNGVKRFVSRVYSFVADNSKKFKEDGSPEVTHFLNKVNIFSKTALERFQYNTVVAKFMETMNFLDKVGADQVSKANIEDFVLMIAPFVPFVAEELWSMLGNEYSVHAQKWPTPRKTSIVEHSMELPVQINGKVRGRVTISDQISEFELKKLVEEDVLLNRHFEGKLIKKFIYVKGKIVNVVV